MIELREICAIGPAYQKSGKRDGKKLAAAVALFRSDTPPSLDDILATVRTTANCADGWMAWSDDKRWTPSWYFTCDDEGSTYTVGLADGADSHEHNFEDAEMACAHFIVKDIEDYGRILDSRRASNG